MSVAVISFRGEPGIPESGSVRRNDSAPCVNAEVAGAADLREAGEGNNPGLNYETACEPDLVRAAQSGDQHAFAELCRRHSTSLKWRIRRIVRNRADADDMLQDTLVRAFSHLAGFRGQCSFRTWIMTIATNNSLMLLRKRRNHGETGFGLVTAEGEEVEIFQISDPMPNPEQIYAKRQASQSLSQAVKMLPPGFRSLIERYHQDELTLVDAANAIGITVGAAKSRLFRARKVLRRHLNDRNRYLD
jgi:RNA polymerase sigma-70 factor (ECF subfamily)